MTDVGQSGGRTEGQMLIVLEVLRHAWRLHPEMRLCQLIANVVLERDVFYVEDEKLIDALKNYDFGKGG